MDYEWLDEYVGKPYREGCEGPDYFDCYGLVKSISERLGNHLPSLSFVLESAARNQLADEHRPLVNRIDYPKFGDIVAIRQLKYVTHIGLYIGCGKMIHATAQTGVTITSLFSPKYATRVEGYYRWNNS